MRHPDEKALALYSGGDLDWLANWRVRRHVSSCERCREAVEEFRAATAVAREATQLPAGLEWDQLALTMKANIHMGLVAGAASNAAAEVAPRRAFRPAVALAALTLAVVSIWLVRTPAPEVTPQIAGADGGFVVEANENGIELKGNGGALTVLNRGRGTATTVSARSSGSAGARFVDSDTGQVTITNVYME